MLHQPQTEFRAGGKIQATCPACGWSRIASSHEHSYKLGGEHVAEMKRLAGREPQEGTP